MQTYSWDFFISPTHGLLTLVGLKDCILTFIEEKPNDQYRLVIGTDSHPRNGSGADFVTAVVVHRKGYGGIYFWKRIDVSRTMVLKTRMYEEALLSLSCAQCIVHMFPQDGVRAYNVEIHVDIGSRGETRDMIAEIVGMIRGSGFNVKTKPDSFVASHVADRHT